MITKLKLCRMRQGMGQWELARLIGISESLLSRIESGKSLATPEVQEKLCKIFTNLTPEIIAAAYTANTCGTTEETSDVQQ